MSKHTRGDASGTFCYSLDDENFVSVFEHEHEAVAEAMEAIECEEGATFQVGQLFPPKQPESFWDTEEFIQKISESDEYSTLISDDWAYSITPEQKQDLGKRVRRAIANWAAENGLQPTFQSVKKVRDFEVINGVAVKKKKPKKRAAK